MRFTRFALAVCLATSLSSSLCAQSITGVYGTPVIDGNIEAIWNDVPSQSFQIPIGGNTVNASLKMMHDDQYLYLSLWVSGQFSEGTWLFHADTNHSTDFDDGDDVFGMVNGTYVDRHIDTVRGRQVVVDDSNVRGSSLDGNGARRVSIARTTFELRKPLDTGDPLDEVFSREFTRFYTSFDCQNCSTGRFPGDSSALYKNGSGLREYRYVLEGPISTGNPGTAEVATWIETENLTGDNDQIQGWSNAVTVEGNCTVFDVTNIGTEGEGRDDEVNENGYFFAQILAGGIGVVSGTILSFSEPTVLPANESTRTLRFFLAPRDAGCGDCQLQFQDNLQPPAGGPVSNNVTVDGATLNPDWDPNPLTFELCGCYAPGDHRSGWIGKTLGSESGSSRSRYLDNFDLCSEGMGYGSGSDSVRVVSRSPSPYGLDMTLEELTDGGQASLEVRRQVEGAEPIDRIVDEAKVFRITAHRRGDKVEITAGYRASRGGAMIDVPVQLSGDGEFELPLRMQIRYSEDPSFDEVVFDAFVRNESGDSIEAFAQLLDWNEVGFANRFGLSAASDVGGRAQASFCSRNTFEFANYPRDTDGDGCPDCEDEFPTRSMRPFLILRGPCCTQGTLYYVYQGGDTDGDGIRDCADPDDDGDGIP
ncbi:MAG: hypothetical protein AAF488_18200, partial [Planctomycetota bacterium]